MFKGFDEHELMRVARILQVINPSGFTSAHNLAAHIYRHAQLAFTDEIASGYTETGGWCVTAYRPDYGDGVGADLCLKVTLSGFGVALALGLNADGTSKSELLQKQRDARQ